MGVDREKGGGVRAETTEVSENSEKDVRAGKIGEFKETGAGVSCGQGVSDERKEEEMGVERDGGLKKIRQDVRTTKTP